MLSESSICIACIPACIQFAPCPVLVVDPIHPITLITLIRMGGTGLRPVVRIHHAAHMASLATILPAFCAAFPDLADNHTSTGLHKELSDSRREVLATLGASTPEYTVAAVHATIFGVSSTPSSSQTNPALRC